jgi:hypothetical protein
MLGLPAKVSKDLAKEFWNFGPLVTEMGGICQKSPGNLDLSNPLRDIGMHLGVSSFKTHTPRSLVRYRKVSLSRIALQPRIINILPGYSVNFS